MPQLHLHVCKAPRHMQLRKVVCMCACCFSTPVLHSKRKRSNGQIALCTLQNQTTTFSSRLTSALRSAMLLAKHVKIPLAHGRARRLACCQRTRGARRQVTADVKNVLKEKKSAARQPEYLLRTTFVVCYAVRRMTQQTAPDMPAYACTMLTLC